MAPITKLSALAFASAVLAVPHSNNHRHLHARVAPPKYGGGSSAAPESSSAAPPAYGSSSYAAPASSSGAPPAYGSSSSAYPVSGSSVPPYPIPSGSSSGAWGTGYSSSSYLAPTGYSSSDCPVKSSTLIWKSSTKVVPVYGESSAPAGYSSAPAVPASSAKPASSAPAYGGSGPGGPGGASECIPDQTITKKVYETVTVTGGEQGSSAAPVSSAAPEYSGPVEKYGGPGHWGWGESSEAAPASSEAPAPSYPAPSGGAPAPSSYAAPSGGAPGSSWGAPSGSASAPSYPAPSSGSPASSSAPAPTYSSTPSTGGGFRGKRGLAYKKENVGLCESFGDVESIGWGYNWEQDSTGLPSGLSYIPELHSSTDPYFYSNWEANAQAAIDAGAQYLFSLNEPDMPDQANLSPDDAADAWMEYMERFAGKAKLVAPAVSNGDGEGVGQDWLKQFLDACKVKGCTIDAINQHWYDDRGNDVDFFKGQMESAMEFGYPMFVGEFGAIGSDEEKSAFLQEVMPWMDSQESIIGYAYFMVSEGLLVNGDGPSLYGKTYCDA